MQVRVLGPIEVTKGARVLTPGAPKQRLVLAVLASRLGQVVSVDELVEAGWGDDLPANPGNALQYQIAQLRKLLEDEPGTPRHLVTMPPGYMLDEATVSSDAAAFVADLEGARAASEAGDDTAVMRLVGEALARWRGDAFADVRYNAFAEGPAARLEEERIAALELRLDVLIRQERFEEAGAELRELTAANPLRERLWVRLVEALDGGGRQPEALRAVQEARAALADVGLDLGADLRELEQRIFSPPNPAEAAPVVRLPVAPNPLIGRADELGRVRSLLDGHRIVTLTGAGGVGKTRIALAAAAGLAPRHVGGTWFVALDRLADEALVAAEIGRVTGLREDPERALLDSLVDHLGGDPVLVVLDNAEHLVEPVAELVHELAVRCPHLSLIVTSQVVLGVAGEAIIEVDPLPTPGATGSIYDPLADVDAVALFRDRAGAVGVDVDAWGDSAYAAVANIVAALDGMPLAIELAAARLRAMTLEEVAHGLEDRFAILGAGPRTAPARQRSLLGALEWSLGLLDGSDRQLVAELGVLVGPFSIDDAQAIASTSNPDMRDRITHLLDRSLLRRSPDVAGAARFSMLESLRHHGVQQLSPGALRDTQDAHLDHFARFAEQADAGLRGSDQVAWLHRLDAGYENLRAAMAWSVDGGDPNVGVRLGAALGRYFDWRGLLREGSEWGARVSAAASELAPGLPLVRTWNAFMAWEFGDLETAERLIEQAMTEVARLDERGVDVTEFPGVLTSRILIRRSRGDLESARALGRELIESGASATHPWYIAWAESALATVELAAGDLDAAENHATRSIDGFSELGDLRSAGWGHLSLAQIRLERGERERAEGDARAALRAARSVEDERSAVWALEIVARAQFEQRRPETAARVWGAAQTLRSRRGVSGSVTKSDDGFDLQQVLGSALGDALERLVADGRAEGVSLIERLASETEWDPASAG